MAARPKPLRAALAQIDSTVGDIEGNAAKIADAIERARQAGAALVGLPERADDVYNSAAVVADGRVAAVYRKNHLPNYGVFDEQRYFQAGTEPALIELGDVSIGLTVCEDIWE